MNEVIGTKDIENNIYTIRGVEVMLDTDLAKIYECANGTKTINLAIKRNIERFPNDFYFQLNSEELKALGLRFQSETLNSKGNLRGQHIKYLPYAFTEQGVAMLATVIRTDKAAQVSINIMRAFVHMRHYIKYNNNLLPNKILLLESKIDNNTARINELFDKFDYHTIVRDKVFFKGEIYDAYSVLVDIFNTSKEEIIIIDNYAGKELLDVLKTIDKRIVIISSNINEEHKKKYLKQYKNVSFIQNDSFHDRFIIIDKKKIYECGSSLKDIGNKCFYIGEIDKEYIKLILDAINI